MTETKWHPSIWIITILCWLLAICFHWIIVKKEMKNRKMTKTPFATRYFEILSMSCIVSGLMASIISPLAWLPGTCYFAAPMGILILTAQLNSMGYYQLSRLYYCFANDKIYSKKGYPNWVFIIMYIAAPVLTLNYLASSILSNSGLIILKCGINGNYEFYQQLMLIEGFDAPIWFIVSTLLVLFYDIITLVLYMYKLTVFRSDIISKSNENVGDRILFILHKTLLLTLFYQIIGVISIVSLVISILLLQEDFVVIAGILHAVVVSITTLSVSYSMYLMMDHNTNDYMRFLVYLKKYKLQSLCCCYGTFVTKQLNGCACETNPRDQNMGYDTRRPTLETIQTGNNNNIGINTKGNELSIETKTVIE